MPDSPETELLAAQHAPTGAAATPAPDRRSRATERRRTVAIGLALFAVTFLVYWFGGPMSTAYDFQLSQANNLIHGHLDLTPEYTHNLNVLERVLYDGQGFCEPLNDPRGPGPASDIIDLRLSANCRTYMQHSLGPALLLVPLVLLFGLSVSQVAVSAAIGGATAVVVFAITRRFSDQLRTQIALTVLAVFGTELWYVAADGGVWFFAHTTAVFFLFAAIYATVNRRSPLLAGVFVGAAFLCRPSTILAGAFPLVAFADVWLPAAASALPLWKRLRIRPLVELAAGVAPFLLLGLLLNELRYGNPLESGYSYSEQFHQASLAFRWPHGIFSPAYIPDHIRIMFEQMPIFGTNGSFVWPSWAGTAVWLISPALLLGLFVHLRHHVTIARIGAVALLGSAVVMLGGAIAGGLELTTWTPADLPFGLHLLPFWLLIAGAITLALRGRDRLVLACWAAILPIALVDFTFAATGWTQFGYRYSLDFLPFLFLLVVLAVPRLRGYHLPLIAASVLANAWGVLWILNFAPRELYGWTWVGW